MENNSIEIVKFVDENVLAKSTTVEQFKRGLEVIRNYLELKGPIDQNTLDYLKSLNDCASEIISIRQKGIILSSGSFFPNKQNVTETGPQYGRHYSAPC